MDFALATASEAGACQIRQIPVSSALALLGGNGSWRQFPAYATAAAKRVGATSSYFGVYDGEASIAAFNLRTKRLPLGLGASALISHGPVLLRCADHWQHDLARTINALKAFASRSGIEIRIDPDMAWSLVPGCDMLMEELDLDPASSPYRTIVLAISDGLDAVRKRLQPKWRSSLRQAESAQLRVVRSSTPEDILRILPLFEELVDRKGFSVGLDPAFFANVASECEEGERVLAHLVYRDDDLVSAHIGAFSGPVAVYLLGATNAVGRGLGASYLAQWHAIQTAIELGQQYYDTGGIDPEANPDVHRFKKRMGGSDITTPGTRVISPHGLRGAMLAGIRKSWTRIRR